VDKLENLLNTFDAYKQLIFSKYFINYFGFDTTSDPDSNLYFMELNRSKNLRQLQGGARYSITTERVLFKHWMKEIALAFRDLLYKCEYSFKFPIGLKNIFIAERGTK
jgi:hypothetical protein